MSASPLILPHGLGKKTSIDITFEEMAWLADAEEICRKLGITIACIRCLQAGIRSGAALRGNNDENDSKLTVTCDCRHMVFRRGPTVES